MNSRLSMPIAICPAPGGTMLLQFGDGITHQTARLASSKEDDPRVGFQEYFCRDRSQVARRFMTHLYGPAARCKPKMMIWRTLVLRFCIRPVDGAIELLAIMDIRARSISFASRPRRPYGSPDHERAGETFSPSPLSDSQTSAGKQHLLPG